MAGAAATIGGNGGLEIPIRANTCEPGQKCTELGCADECGDGLCDVGMECFAEECLTPEAAADERERASRCESDEDCSMLARCVSGACVTRERGEAQAGDACSDASECSSGVCTEGLCALACESDTDCLTTQTCDDQGRYGICVGAAGGIGDLCDSPDDCLGQRCVKGAEPEPICTRPCGAELPACPHDWKCSEVDGEHVCITLGTKRAGGGCSVGRSRTGWFPLSVLVAAAAALSAGRRRS